MILCIENPKEYTRKQLVLMNEFGKVAEYKTNSQKSGVCVCVYNKNEQSEKGN